MTETGIRRTADGGMFCEKCGNDLTVDGSSKFIAHADGRKFYQNTFECVKCGAILTQKHERDPEDAAWWA